MVLKQQVYRNFSIELGEELDTEQTGELSLVGSLAIDSESVSFVCPISYWNRDQYRQQWKTGLERILETDASSSCLVTSVRGPGRADHVFLFELHRKGRIIYIRERYIPYDRLDEQFDPEEPYSLVGSAEVVVETDGETRTLRGEAVAVGAIRRFLDSWRRES